MLNTETNSEEKKEFTKPQFDIDVQVEEERHKKTLSHFLEKIHKTNAYQNKDVAEILDIDKGTYSKIRQNQIAPLTNSIITIKRFAYLNDLSILDFIAKIEEIPNEVKDNDWLSALNNIMSELGAIMRTELIHNRLADILKNDPDHLEKFRKCFVLLTLLIDLLSNEKWFNFCTSMIVKIHDNIGIMKTKNLEALIARIKIKKK